MDKGNPLVVGKEYTLCRDIIPIRIAVSMVKDYSLRWLKCRSSEEKLLNQNISYDLWHMMIMIIIIVD